MRIFSIGVTLTLTALVLIATFLTINNTLASTEIDNLRYGLEISDPTFNFVIEGTTTTLVIDGVVKNVAIETVKIPKLKGALVNNLEEEIIVWVFEADHSEAKAGETVNYSTRVTNPPPGLVGMIVTFISDEEASKIPGSWKY